MLHPNEAIKNYIVNLMSKMGVKQQWACVIYVLSSSLIVPLEEIYIARDMYSRTVPVLAIEQHPFDELCESDQKALYDYYNAISSHQANRLKIMAREASIQLCYQNLSSTSIHQ